MIRWTGLAPWEFEFLFPGSVTSTFLWAGGRAGRHSARRDCLMCGLDCLMCGLDCLTSGLDYLTPGLDCLICAKFADAQWTSTRRGTART